LAGDRRSVEYLDTKNGSMIGRTELERKVSPQSASNPMRIPSAGATLIPVIGGFVLLKDRAVLVQKETTGTAALSHSALLVTGRDVIDTLDITTGAVTQ
jgi:hypothetical protein